MEGIKMVICDVDGTLTDGGMYITESGDHFKRFNAKDGVGVKILKQHGIEVGLISHSRVSNIVYERAKMLKIDYCYVGSGSKIAIANKWLKALNITLDEVAYLGDDINDRKIMQAVKVSACPSDAHSSILKIADVVLKSKGGGACLREFVDDIMQLELKD